MATFGRGKDAQAFITDAVGTARELTTFVDSAEPDLTSQVLPTTCWGSAYESSVRGFLGYTGTMKGKYDVTTGENPDKWFRNLITAASTLTSTFTLYPAGSSAGHNYESANVFFMNYKKSIPFDNIVSWSIDWQLANGSVTFATL